MPSASEHSVSARIGKKNTSPTPSHCRQLILLLNSRSKFTQVRHHFQSRSVSAKSRSITLTRGGPQAWFRHLRAPGRGWGRKWERPGSVCPRFRKVSAGRGIPDPPGSSAWSSGTWTAPLPGVKLRQYYTRDHYIQLISTLMSIFKGNPYNDTMTIRQVTPHPLTSSQLIIRAASLSPIF